MTLPTDPAARKAIPLCTGVLDYFSAALVEVAKCSQRGNDQHNPGQPLHWARGKSSDHLDAMVRHLLERDLVGVAWRALAALQMDCEARGAPLARGAREPAKPLPGVVPQGLAEGMAVAMLRDRVLATDDDAGAPGEPPREPLNPPATNTGD